MYFTDTIFFFGGYKEGKLTGSQFLRRGRKSLLQILCYGVKKNYCGPTRPKNVLLFAILVTNIRCSNSRLCRAVFS